MQTMVPPLAQGLADLGLFDATVHDFAAMFQGVVAVGVGEAPPSPSPTNPAGMVAALFLLNILLV